jgi:hypothetical protein
MRGALVKNELRWVRAMRIDVRFSARALVALALACAHCSTSNGDGGAAPDDTNAGTSASAGGSSGTAGTGSGGTVGGSAGTGTSGSSGKSGTAGDGGSIAGNGAGADAGHAGNGASGATGEGGAPASGGSAGDPGDGSGGGAGGSDEPEGTLTVFYLDVGGSVMKTEVEDPEARTVVEDAGQGPDGIALDMTRGHIYWTGMGVPAEDDGFILRADLDGGNIVTIVPAGGTYTPKQLKIDQDNGKLYWSDREGMRVMRSNLDGSQLETLVTTGMGAADRSDSENWCVGIALDVAGGYFYWSQKGSDNGMVGSLRRARITMPEGEDSTNRSDIEILFAGLPEPIDVDLDLENGHIYWTDRGDDTINRAPIEVPAGATASTREDREVLIEGVREAIGVTLDLERGKLYFTGGTGGRVGMANLDGSGLVDLLTGSAGLTGIAVVELP